MNGKDYYNLELKEIERIKTSGVRPRLLMHSCCGPCNSYPIEYLSPIFDLTLYFNNHNIFPEEEFVRRLNELKAYVQHYEQQHHVSIDIVVPPYEDPIFNQVLAANKDAKEGGNRCKTCYAMRMNEAWQYASDHGYDYMTTVMTVSRHKDSVIINEIARRLSKKYPKVAYFYSNFKKNKGMDRSIELSRHFNMYRQSYCGCVYSYEDSLLRQKRRESVIDNTPEN